MPLPPPPPGYEKRMPWCEEATELCHAGLDALGREVRLTRSATEAWRAMQHAASEEGVHLLLISGFRSRQRQTAILEEKLNAGMELIEILKVNAYPGYSEHHTGFAVDIGSPDCKHLSEAFEATQEFAWLNRHAASFDFSLSYPRSNAYGILFEPWHWCMKSACTKADCGG
jgi:D-alanyl-D-alanine carboxypeptidase